MHGVLHLHRLEDDEHLACLHPVAGRYRHPDHAAWHGSERGAGCHLFDSDGVAVDLDQAGRTVGAVDVGHSPHPLHQVAAGDAVRGQVDPVGPNGARRQVEHVAVEDHIVQGLAAATHPVGDLMGIGADGERDPLVVDGVVAPPGRQSGQRPCRRMPCRLAGQRGGNEVTSGGGRVGQGGGKHVEAMAVEESRVGGAGTERLVAQGADQQVAVGRHSVDTGHGQGSGQGCDRLGAGRSVRDDLGHHGVVVRADHATGLDSGVEPHPGAVGRNGELVEVPGRREPSQCRVFGIQAGLYGVADRAPGHRSVHLVGQGEPSGDEELQAHQVEPGHLLGHRVLHLETGVHLQEVGVAVAWVAGGSGVAPGVEDELDRAGVDVANGPGGSHGCLGQPGTERWSDHR